ncbi:MAG: Zn-dependent oligopeptidase [Acidobacteria bacterium]|nr:Zn-dependent oligopeptidase [Acidobacteriota bacterium]MCB9397192.1 Zn-dependent oligopeptidase [Acidobacteriota bacterium]
MNPLLRESGQELDYAAISVDHIRGACDSAIQHAESTKQKILAAPDGQKWGRLYGFDDYFDHINQILGPLELLNEVRPDLSETCQVCITRLHNFLDETFLDESLFRALKAFQMTFATMTGAELILMERLLFAFQRNGLQLPEQQRQVFRALSQEITQLELAFQHAISDDATKLTFDQSDLLGVPENVCAHHKQADGSYVFPLVAPSVLPLLTFAECESTRKTTYLAYLNKAAPSNIDTLETLLQKRYEKAHLLGYETYADYELAEKMAQTPHNVNQFINDLHSKSHNKAKKDLEFILDKFELKALEPWNKSYYFEKARRAFYSVDQMAYRAYFPLEKVLAFLFQQSETLFDVSVCKADLPVWHESVRSFEVFQDKKLIARFFLDLHPRTGKYSHAACFGLSSGKETGTGYRTPEAALVCNFLPGQGDEPCLLTHDEVETVFHEFGHLWHQLLTQCPFSLLAGTSVLHDFVETPSQFFELWAWRKDSLKAMSAHWQTGEPLPDEMIERLLVSDRFNTGIDLQQQLFYSALDMAYHAVPIKKKLDTTAVIAKLQGEMTPFPYVENTHFQAGFGHLVGYAAGYYGYLYSRVFAEDLAEMVRQVLDQPGGPSVKELGRRLRKYLFGPGGGEDPHHILRALLGRDPDPNALLKRLAIVG